MQLKRRELEEILRLALEKNRELASNNRHLVSQKQHQQAIIKVLRAQVAEILDSLKSWEHIPNSSQASLTAQAYQQVMTAEEQLQALLKADLNKLAKDEINKGKR